MVRVQDYYQVRYEDGAEWHEFFVELSARREYPPQDEVYVCRFGVGGGFWYLPDHHDIRFSPDRERGLYAIHFKAMLQLARWPGLAWRRMNSTFPGAMQKLWEENYIIGRPV